MNSKYGAIEYAQSVQRHLHKFFKKQVQTILKTI